MNKFFVLFLLIFASSAFSVNFATFEDNNYLNPFAWSTTTGLSVINTTAMRGNYYMQLAGTNTSVTAAQTLILTENDFNYIIRSSNVANTSYFAVGSSTVSAIANTLFDISIRTSKFQINDVDLNSSCPAPTNSTNYLIHTRYTNSAATFSYQIDSNAGVTLCKGTHNVTNAGVPAKFWLYTNVNLGLDNLYFGSSPPSNFGRIYFYDENSGTALTGVTVDWNGVPDTLSTAYFDFNTINLTGTQTLNFSKTGYSNRSYQADINADSLIVNFALIPDSLDLDVLFKVYQTDETTLFTNTYVELLDKDTNYSVGKAKTNATGEITFNLNSTDNNYYISINNGYYSYTPVALTILKPKNEISLGEITEKYRIDVTTNLFASFIDINTSKVIYLLPNTALPFNIKISDNNTLASTYFSRTYARQYPGNPLTDTLQPYLVPYANGLATTIKTVSGYTNQPVENVQIKIYKLISGLGKTYVEEILTDSKGEALVLLVAGDSYEFEIYYNSTYIRTDSITANSTSIYIPITNFEYTNKLLGNISASVIFYPINASLGSMDRNLVQIININDFNSDKNIQNIWIEVWNTDRNGVIGSNILLFQQTKTYADENQLTNIFDINYLNQKVNFVWYDTNGRILINVILKINDTNYVSTFSYRPYITSNALVSLGFGSRTFWGCSSYYDSYGNPNPLIPCGNMLFVALFISFILTVGASFEFGLSNPTGLGIVFLMLMGIFTFFTYVPIVLYGLLVACALVVIIVARGRFN